MVATSCHQLPGTKYTPILLISSLPDLGGAFTPLRLLTWQTSPPYHRESVSGWMVEFCHLPAETFRDDLKAAEPAGETQPIAPTASLIGLLPSEFWVFVKMRECTARCRHKLAALVTRPAVLAMNSHFYQTE